MVNHLEQLRQLIASDTWPLNINEWPYELNENTNCLAFALGLPFADVNRDTFRFPRYSRIEKELEKWFSCLNLEYRIINSIDEAKNDEIIIKSYEFILPIYNIRDYHIIRRNVDGTWVHKPGWEEAPCEIKNWNTFSLRYISTLISQCMFAVNKKI